jgi:hypothetical protein
MTCWEEFCGGMEIVHTNYINYILVMSNLSGYSYVTEHNIYMRVR